MEPANEYIKIILTIHTYSVVGSELVAVTQERELGSHCGESSKDIGPLCTGDQKGK